jgi:hypothetical protein
MTRYIINDFNTSMTIINSEKMRLKGDNVVALVDILNTNLLDLGKEE